MRNGYYICFLLFLLPWVSSTQTLLPPIYNYKVFEYNAGAQNWGLTVDEKGHVFSANDKGLLSFNGEEWILNKLPNATILRSVTSVKDKVYTGSYEEFGYWQTTETGELNYTSLTHLIQNHTFTSEEFWQILPFKEAVYFRSFSALYKYEEGRITVIDPEFVITGLAVYDGKVYVAAKNLGLYVVNGEKLEPIGNDDVLKDQTVTDMASFKDGLLIGTQLNGCVVYQNGQFTSLDKNMNSLLKKYQLNKLIALETGEIAFGTIKNGIYLFDSASGSYRNLNRKTGLQNNTVLSLAKFKDQFWVGLESGMDRIQVNSAITFYTDHTGALGTTHDVAIQDNSMYLGSNTGIYYFKDDELQFFEGSQGHVWDLELIANDVLAGHNTGTFKVDGEKLTKISDRAGGYQFVKVPEKNNVFLQGTYTGVTKYIKDSNNRWNVSTVTGIDFPVKQLCFEDNRTIWAAHHYKGLFRFKLNEDLTAVEEKTAFDTTVLPNIYNVRLYRIKNQIVMQSEGNWFKYDPLVGKIATLEEFEPFTNKSLIYSDGEHFWFLKDADTKELLYTDLRNNAIAISETQLNQRLMPDMERAVKRNDSIYLLTLSDGFAKMNIAQLQRQLNTNAIPVPELTFFKDDQERYSVKDSLFEVPYAHSQELILQLSVPSMVQPRYYYELKGPLEQEAYRTQGTLEFQNLPHGDYTLNVHSVTMDNRMSSPKTIAFAIASPWYLSKLSMLGYVLILVLIVLGVRWYNRQKLRRKHEILKIRLQREQEERLAQLEKEKLEKEIKRKQTELARTTMSVAKKNELILELKDLMVLNKDAFPNKQRYRSLTKKLDGSINENEDWKNFEVNFKELHDDFFDNLLQQFPKLTPKDLKLCAYLKMNLSSKEIAPLMAISIRGVEIHRYRLRKKLGIDSSQNLSNFLIKFK
ncbi:helix-turn-helix and ligand-binding sensor domain-containing protein [Zobellia russellii]|uniref:helix-turn-helix and ligand-binding sensor domain-containing protein n=1 Tax=Zobellia russellii TaxID=248907 RepID=UPI001BFFAB99|nr:LuxR C-terminal-related transcriptional regulator [Zobellia russellii]MBT9189063.1 Two component regulator three Y domain-containing protein [Zobellia russellii]